MDGCLYENANVCAFGQLGPEKGRDQRKVAKETRVK